MEQVEMAIDKGGLYQYYYDQNFRCTEDFEALMFAAVSKADYAAKMDFLNRLSEYMKRRSYDTYDGLWILTPDLFADDDLSQLKQSLLDLITNRPTSFMIIRQLSIRL